MTDREQPHAALGVALAAALDAGQPIPCRGPQRGLWTSEAPRERATAATLCGPCAILDACREAAEQTRERWGVWSGLDRSAGPGRRANR